jgi:hypothetical protein
LACRQNFHFKLKKWASIKAVLMITKLEDQVNETKKHVVDLNKKEKELKGTFNIHKSNVAELEAEKRRANQKV